MTKAYVAEFAEMPVTFGNNRGAAPMPPLAEQVVDYTAGVATSAVFNVNTKFIRVHVDSIASVRVVTGSDVAAATNMRMAAGATEYFVVPSRAADYKLSAITNT